MYCFGIKFHVLSLFFAEYLTRKLTNVVSVEHSKQ